jgi:hypothetical protein
MSENYSYYAVNSLLMFMCILLLPFCVIRLAITYCIDYSNRKQRERKSNLKQRLFKHHRIKRD